MICIFIFHYSDKFLRYMFHMFHKVCKGIPKESIFWFFFWKYQEIQNFLYPLIKCPIFLELKRKLSQCHIPPNIRLDEDVFRLRLQKTSRRLDQDEYIRLSHTSSRRLDQDLIKTSWSRPIYSSWLYIFMTSWRRFQDVFKTSSRRFAKTS